MEEKQQENGKKETKINFFKKIWYSIGRPSKYDEMVNLGFGKAVKYFLGLISILGAIFAMVIMIVLVVSGDINMDIGDIIFNFVIYFASGILTLCAVYILYTLLISVSIFLVIKMFKLGQKFRDAVSLALYSSTLSVIIYTVYMIVYLIYLYPNGINADYFEAIAILIICIYVGIFFRKRRGSINNVFYRRNKKKGKK